MQEELKSNKRMLPRSSYREYSYSNIFIKKEYRHGMVLTVMISVWISNHCFFTKEIDPFLEISLPILIHNSGAQDGKSGARHSRDGNSGAQDGNSGASIGIGIGKHSRGTFVYKLF